MRFYNIIFFTIVSLIGLGACEDKKVDTEAVKKELDARKIKKVKPGEILAFAEMKGAKILSLIKTGSETEIDSIILANNCEYKVVNSNENNERLNGIELSMLEAYQYSLEKKAPMPDNVQPIEKGNRIIFTRALEMDSSTVEMQVVTMWRKFIVLEM